MSQGRAARRATASVESGCGQRVRQPLTSDRHWGMGHALRALVGRGILVRMGIVLHLVAAIRVPRYLIALV